MHCSPFRILIATCLLLLAGASVASSSAQPSPKLRPPGIEQICRAQYLNCMWGSNSSFCGWNYQDCLRGGSTHGVLIGKNSQPATELPQLSPQAEREIARFKTTVAMNDSKPRSRGLGDTYCLKMLRACDAGNQSACDRFERYCAP